MNELQDLNHVPTLVFEFHMPPTSLTQQVLRLLLIHRNLRTVCTGRAHMRCRIMLLASRVVRSVIFAGRDGIDMFTLNNHAHCRPAD